MRFRSYFQVFIYILPTSHELIYYQPPFNAHLPPLYNMTNTEVIQLPNYITTETAISKISPLGYVVCLSGAWGQKNATQRYDIMSAAPSLQLYERESQLYTKDNSGKIQLENASSFEWLEDYFKEANSIPTSVDSYSNTLNLPLIFGFIGYISYDYGKQLETLPTSTIDDTSLMDFCGGIYHWNLINDKLKQISYLTFGPQCPSNLKPTVINAINAKPASLPSFRLNNCFQKNTEYNSYQKAFDRISHYISEGDCYQINYSHRHQARYTGSPALAYTLLNKQLNTPYSAYLQFDNHQILSLSPERFIKINGNKVETKPIKGTTHRSNRTEEDDALKIALSCSIKDRAENLMIVDLLRNDLNRTCLPGSVKVPKLFEVETYPNVHHLVSTVTGTKSQNTSPLEVLKKSFPGGSITGAPKIRAMEIIEELETHRRSIYCGSILYLGFDGSMDSNICIRTLLCKNDTIYCWGGGGIVADSTCEDEYKESITKVKNLMDILEGINGVK